MALDTTTSPLCLTRASFCLLTLSKGGEFR